MRATVTLDSKILENLKKFTKENTNSKAVIKAINDYIRKEKFKKIKTLAGKIHFDMKAEEIRHDRNGKRQVNCLLI